MNEIPKVVFSKTLTRADWPTTTIACGDLEAEVAELKAELDVRRSDRGGPGWSRPPRPIWHFG